MSKKNHTLPIIITLLCLVIGGALLSYHFAPSSPTRTSHTDHNTPNKVLPNTTPPAQITEESTLPRVESEHNTPSLKKMLFNWGAIPLLMTFIAYCVAKGWL